MTEATEVKKSQIVNVEFTPELLEWIDKEATQKLCKKDGATRIPRKQAILKLLTLCKKNFDKILK